MLDQLDYTTLEDLIDDTIPSQIRLFDELKIDDPVSEAEIRTRFEEAAAMNASKKSFIGESISLQNLYSFTHFHNFLVQI